MEFQPTGPPSPLRRLGDSLLALAQCRVQLFALELRSETLRLAETMLWLGGGLAVGGMGLLLGVITLALYLWKVAGFAGLWSMTVVLVGIAGLVLWRLRERLCKGPLPFAGTIAEFKKDRACLHKPD